jgi:hypothetical protein
MGNTTILPCFTGISWHKNKTLQILNFFRGRREVHINRGRWRDRQ